MKYFGVFVLILILLGFEGQEGTKKEKKARQRLEMAQLIQNGKFRFVARSANSVIGNFNHLSYGYNMAFDSSHIVAYLPYYGRSYEAHFGDDGGVKFDLMADSVNKKWIKKKKLFQISTKLYNASDDYTIFLFAGLDGYAELRLNFRDRTWINYYGTIEKLDVKEVSSN